MLFHQRFWGLADKRHGPRTDNRCPVARASDCPGPVTGQIGVVGLFLRRLRQMVKPANVHFKLGFDSILGQPLSREEPVQA
jgi:hypothetical protein